MSTPQFKGKPIDSPEAIRNRTEVQLEINKHKVSIDRTVFRKTKEEKEQLKVAKSQHKAILRIKNNNN